MTVFYDSARPDLIPAGAHACLYYDGEFTPTEAEVKRLGPVRWITVLGGAGAAAHTGCIDSESGNDAYDPAPAPRVGGGPQGDELPGEGVLRPLRLRRRHGPRCMTSRTCGCWIADP